MEAKKISPEKIEQKQTAHDIQSQRNTDFKQSMRKQPKQRFSYTRANGVLISTIPIKWNQ